jgi:hypothetical protein
MTAFSDLQHHLKHYWAMPHHDDYELNVALNEVQAWQRIRIQRTHSALFAQPDNKLMADYFLTQLYGGKEFKMLAVQLARILPKAEKLESLIKESALKTGSMGIDAAVLAIELDLHLAQWLVARNLPVTEKNVMTAYRTIDESAERREQVKNLKEVCYRTDKYLNSFFLQKAFQLAKSTVYRLNYQLLYDFVDAGFNAMKPLDSVGSFIDPFCVREMLIIERIHADKSGKLTSFDVL